MISSRAEQPAFGPGSLNMSALRRRIRDHLEAARLFGDELFSVWIHEDAEAAAGTNDAWEESLRQIRQAQVVLVLYNGQAGWALEDGEVGICHAEMATALDTEPAKVRLVRVEPLAALPDDGGRGRDERFRDLVERRKLFHGAVADDVSLATAGAAAVQVWSLDKRNAPLWLRGRGAKIYSLAISMDGFLAAGDEKGRFMVWDLHPEKYVCGLLLDRDRTDTEWRELVGLEEQVPICGPR